MAEVLNLLVGLKGQLDAANEASDKAQEVKKYVDLFEVTMAMIPTRKRKDSQIVVVKAESKTEKQKSIDSESKSDVPENDASTVADEADEDDKKSLFEEMLPKGFSAQFESAKTGYNYAAKAITALIESKDIETTFESTKTTLFGCLESSIRPKKTPRNPTAGERLLEKKNKGEASDLDITFDGIDSLVESGFAEIQDAVEIVIEISKHPPNLTWIVTPWKFQELLELSAELDDHLAKIDKFINLLQAAISVASYAVSLEQLDNTMNAANAIEHESFKKFWKKRIGTQISRVPVNQFADTFMSSHAEALLKYHRKDLRYWPETIEDSPDTPDAIYRRSLFSRFKLPAGVDYLSVYSINKCCTETNLPGDKIERVYKGMDQLFEELKKVELSFTRRIRFDILTYDENEGRIKINKGLKFSGVYKVKPFQRLFISCTAPVYKEEVSSYDCFTLLKYNDDFDFDDNEATLEERRKYRLYVKKGIVDPVYSVENSVYSNKFPVTMPILRPKPPGFISNDNYANINKNVKKSDAKVDKYWIQYQYSNTLETSYVDKYQRMLYCPVLFEPGLFTVRYCLDDLHVEDESNKEASKALALKSSKCYYYNRDIPSSGASILTHLAALTGPSHADEFGKDILQKKFTRLYLSYLKEVELKEARWQKNDVQMDKLLDLRELIKTGNEEKSSDIVTISKDDRSKKNEHTKFDGIRVFKYDLTNTGDDFEYVTTEINTSDGDVVLDIVERIKKLICLPPHYPSAEAIAEARVTLGIIRAAASGTDDVATKKLKEIEELKASMTPTQLAQRAMNAAAAWLDEIVENYHKRKEAAKLAELEVKHVHAHDHTKGHSPEYDLYQSTVIQLLKFQYFFVIRDIVKDIGEANTKALKSTTLAELGKKFYGPARTEKLEQWKSKKVAMETLLNFEYACIPDEFQPEYQALHANFKKAVMIDCTKAKAFKDLEKCFVKNDDKEQYIQYLKEIADVEIEESLKFRKYTRAIELYEFKVDISEKKNRVARERKKRSNKGDANNAQIERQDSTNAEAEVTNERKILKSRQDILTATITRITKLKNYVKILRKDIEHNFANVVGQDRGPKLKRMDDCRFLIDLLYGIKKGAEEFMPEFYQFQIQTHLPKKTKKCPVGLLIEVEKDYGLAWGECPVIDGTGIIIEEYLEKFHVRVSKQYPYNVSPELKVSLYDEKQPMKYVVLIAAAEEKDDMFLRIKPLDHSDEMAAGDAESDIPVVGNDFIRYGIVDIESLFKKLHESPKQSNTLSGTPSNTPRHVAFDTPGLDQHPVPPQQESDVLSLFRHLKSLRKGEEKIKFKLDTIEKLIYDLNECYVWQSKLRVTMRALVKRQFSMIDAIRKRALEKPAYSEPVAEDENIYANYWEKTVDRVRLSLAKEDKANSNAHREKQNTGISYDAIVERHQLFGEVFDESLDDSSYDEDYEVFESDLEGIAVLSRKVNEYKKLSKMQHIFLTHLGKILDLSNKHRKHFKKTVDVKEFEDITQKHERTMKKLNIPPDFVLLDKDIFLKEKLDGSATPAIGISTPSTPLMTPRAAISVPESTTLLDNSGENEFVVISKEEIAQPLPSQLTPINSTKLSILPPDTIKEETLTPKKDKRKRGTSAIIELIQDILREIKEDFKAFWSECDETTKNEGNQEVFRAITTDDVLRKRHGELEYDKESASKGELTLEDNMSVADNDEEKDENDPNDHVKSRNDEDENSDARSVTLSESTAQLDSEIGEATGDAKALESEGGEYLKAFKAVQSFLDIFTKSSGNTAPLLYAENPEFISRYYELYNSDLLDFPINEYYSELATMTDLISKFLDEVSESVYSKTTFEVQLLNSTKTIVDRKSTSGNHNSLSLRIVFTENSAADDVVFDDEENDDNVDVQHEEFGEDFTYLEDERVDDNGEDDFMSLGKSKEHKDD